MIEIISGDILFAKEKYIAHQCNCVSKNAGGVAWAIFDKYPYSNVYANRIEPSKMGTIDIRGNDIDQRYIINMFAQYMPGTPIDSTSIFDSANIREKSFYHCLLRIVKIPDLHSIAFPYKIGCGLAGGNWTNYLGNLNNFSEHKQNVRVVIYKRDEDI
jgi:O-acetyl-ADP-ribose deacetylase (regulator of RNase III)